MAAWSVSRYSVKTTADSLVRRSSVAAHASLLSDIAATWAASRNAFSSCSSRPASSRPGSRRTAGTSESLASVSPGSSNGSRGSSGSSSSEPSRRRRWVTEQCRAQALEAARFSSTVMASRAVGDRVPRSRQTVLAYSRSNRCMRRSAPLSASARDAHPPRHVEPHVRPCPADSERLRSVSGDRSDTAQPRELLVAAGVRRGREQQHVSRAGCDRRCGGPAIGSRPQRVSLVHDQHVPRRARHGREHLRLFHEVD